MFSDGGNVINSDFAFKQTDIDGVMIITPFLRSDERGFFLKDYNEEVFQKFGLDYSVREVFYSYSKKNTIRGLHFQRDPQMPKLVRCLAGKIYDVAVDLRSGSTTFGKHIGIELSEENNLSLLVPSGCAHGFFAVSDAYVSYKCAEIFAPETDDGIIWSDSEIGINWPFEYISDVIISEKDADLQTFAAFKGSYGSL